MKNTKAHRKPPRLAAFFLNHILPDEQWCTPVGDFEEFFNQIAHKKGILKAQLWYWGQILNLLPKKINSKIRWSIIMFNNYLKITLRNIIRQKGYSFINIFGLALGLACCLIVLIWAQDEFSYDRFHTNLKEIYMTWADTEYSDGKREVFTGSFYPLADLIRSEFPEVVEVARVGSSNNVLINHVEKQFSDNVVGYVDPSFFSIFTLEFIQGDPVTAFKEKLSVVITEEMSLKYFGITNAIGKILTVNNQYDVQVSGIIENIPSNSSLQCDCLMPFELWFGPEGSIPTHWGGNPFNTFVLLHEKAVAEEIGEKITKVVLTHNPMPPDIKASIKLHPFSKLHLYNVDGGGLITSITIFAIIAVFILCIACINYMNLSTARASKRAGEVGMRKVAGAKKIDLIKQFFGESLLLSMFSLLLAILMVYLFLPTFNAFVGKQLSLSAVTHASVILGFIIITVITGLLAGSYPALFLSSFKPAKILRGTFTRGKKGLLLRQILVMSQFSLSIFLIIGTAMIYKQLDFIRNKDLGFNKNNIISLSMSGELKSHYESVKSELLLHENILTVTRSLQHPAYIASTVSAVDWDGKNPGESVVFNWDYIDFDYIETFQMEIMAGRSFAAEFATDVKEGYVVNEEAVKIMGMDDPVGQRLSIFRNEGRIIGVVKNFHFQPLTNKIQPFVFGMMPSWTNYMFIRIHPENITETMNYVKGIFKKFNPNYPAEIRFFTDDVMRRNYSTEQQITKVAGYFSLLAILISCLGLFGLASYIAVMRTKEIGIRKVVGARVSRLVFMLSKDFTKWVILSNIIAWPCAYLVTHKLLLQYVYRIKVTIDLFLLSALAALGIAILTVSYQAYRAARINPVDSLKYE